MAGEVVEEVLREFLAAACHMILHSRHIYPREIFERRRLFDVTVFRSRHKELNEYIDMAVHGVCELLQRGEADAMVLAVLGPPTLHSPDLHPVVHERYRFALSFTPHATTGTSDLSAQLRAFLVKLHFCDSLLSPLRIDATKLTFRIEAHSKPVRCLDALPPELNEQWIELDTSSELGASGGSITPLKSMNSGSVSLQLFVQELG
ncbi:hypothetical protein AB1Y20_009626 [Prymnesium parvum]|uniref:HORMA domain-containing protein n=1 Tax=Prymnesium parvum TaxID=97485 RepID=A0AB34K0X9_PRYPA